MALRVGFPRVNSRGPIEASLDLGRASGRSSDFRELILAAPLKLGLLGVLMVQTPNFRELILAAPLKPI